MHTTDYTNLAAEIAPEITALGRDQWKVTAPRALPETDRDGARVIVHIEQGSARVTVLWELVEAPQWDLTINISGLPSKWDAEEVADYATAIKIADRVARLLQHHLA
jgi:hypothetical protein